MKIKKLITTFNVCAFGYALCSAGVAIAQQGTLVDTKSATLTRGHMHAVIIEKGPAIDGTLKDPLWNKAAVLPMGACTRNDSQKYKTEARVLFDSKNIYIGVSCMDPQTDHLAKSCTQRDGDVWQDDTVELFVRADPEEPYHQFVINPIGTLTDVQCTGPGAADTKWNSSAEAKAGIENGKGWTVTIRVPLKDLNAYVGENETWTMNIYRTRPKRGDDPLLEYSWALMGSNNFNAPGDFGVVTGVNITKLDDGVTRIRKEPPPPPKLLDKGIQAGDVIRYKRVIFDKDIQGFSSFGKAKLSLTDDAISGKALLCAGEGHADFSGFSTTDLSIGGSRGLRIAFVANGKNFPYAGLNISDKKSNDNTTPRCHRFLLDDKWVPVLYYADQFRYNGSSETVAGDTEYTGVSFYNFAKEPWSLILDNFVIYRGEDRTPPAKVTGLKVQPISEGVQLSWEPAEDNVDAMLYVISRAEGNGPFTKIAESCPTKFLDTTAGGAKYRYRVLAVDFEENLGDWSDAVAVSSISKGKQPELAQEEQDRVTYAAHMREVHARGAGKVVKNSVRCFGDSLTHATSYRECVMSGLGNLSVSAMGVPCMKTSWGRENVAGMIKSGPEYLLVLFGTNNGKDEAAIAAAMADMEAIAKAGDEAGTVILFGTIPPRGFADPESTPEATYNNKLAELGRKLGVPVGYIFRDIQAAGDRHKFISDDGVHWTGAGMELAGKAWRKTMAQVQWVVRDRP